MMTYENVKLWWIHSNGRQVDAVTVTSSKPVQLVGIGVAKEVTPDFPNPHIQWAEIVKGKTTGGEVVYRGSENAPFKSEDKQVEFIAIDTKVVLGTQPYTIKVKMAGKGLYFGEPKKRIDPLIGPDGTQFTFADPDFKGQDFKNGQCHIGGPLVQLFYKPA